MMKNRIITNSVRNIKKSFPRFISLIVMSMLGVFTFSGLQATTPDMVVTLDSYFDETNLYDIKIVSTMGLVDEDIEKINKIDGISNVEGVYSKDIVVKNKEKDIVINVSSITDEINKNILIDGRMPTNPNEIVVEKNLLKKEGLSIGDKINLSDDTFINKEVTIVGTVDSSLYFNNTKLNQNRGNTGIGAGIINYYTYMLKENFDQNYYSMIYLTVEGAKNEITSYEPYNKLISNTKEKIEGIKEEQQKVRYENLYNDSKDEIDQKEKEAKEELKKAKEELDSAKEELDKGKKQLDDAENKLKKSQKELDTAKKKLDSGKKQLNTFKIELESAKKQIDNAKIELNNTIKKYNIKLEDIELNITTLKGTITNIESIVKNLDKTSDVYKEYISKLETLKAQLSALEELNDAKKKIEENEKRYNENLDLYNSSYSDYEKNLDKYNSGVSSYENGKKEYDENLIKYNENLEKYNEGYEEYNNSKKEAEEKISDAREKLKEITYPKWYIYDRTDYTTYGEYIDDTKSITNLSKIFPTVFFAVAILVSLISMNRMVEEDRVEIGTMKSLGFSNKNIMIKYLIFSLFATFLGSLIGSILGLTVIPLLIFNIYGILFDVPNFKITLNPNMTFLSFVIVIICVCGTTIYTVYKVLKEKPSELMRPKAPKAGKRVVLEKITFIWKHLKFSKKIIIRNIFRYKKRVIVTIVGIAGCTALMLCGFGIKDAISDIALMQYEKVFKFEGMVYVDEIEKEKIAEIFDNEKIIEVTPTEIISAEAKNNDVKVLIAENNEQLSKIVNLTDKENLEKVELEENKVIITDKFAELANLKVGDTVEILDINNNSYKYEISAIVKNYLEHFIYMTSNTFEKSNQQFKPNIVYINTDENINEKELSQELLKNDEIISISYKKDLLESVDNMLKSLDKVVAILIILAAMLSFVVLYNLSNININERKREIATLKVLGFYNKEVDDYITKENIILTIIGIAIGLIAGIFLTKGVISTVEMEKTRFIYQIKLNSYIYASILSIIFTIIVNIITHFNLKKINMIDSLKSIE